MSSPPFDELIHQPHRLRICVLLAGVEEMSFQALCDELDVTMPTLSKQLKMLTEAGYVKTRKFTLSKRQSTWAHLTPAGSAALKAHLAALRSMADQVL
ncbi:winged helix-turn-helix domain-containing protein [Austwickia chelonae]|uniref:winged helix-turn-helix domain-containing protein n=1 Tax=Austwickia chelonae TaxID=100225 RepID=UPI000E230B03|nr:helix-turn-helix domain-containing protein [Austwickia chelonae]